MKLSFSLKVSALFGLIILFNTQPSFSQLVNADLKELRKEWGKKEFKKANTARFAMFMLRPQKRTMLYMNLARQDGKKFTKLVVEPYTKKYPEHEKFYIELKNRDKGRLYPSFRLWLAAVPHSFLSGLFATEGHQGFDARMLMTFNFGNAGENCSYGYHKGLEVTLQLLNSPPHKRNIMDKNYKRAAVSKFIHWQYG